MKKTMKEIRNSQAMKKFIHNKKAMLGLAIVTILVLAVCSSPFLQTWTHIPPTGPPGSISPRLMPISWERTMWAGTCLQGFYMEVAFPCL